MIKTALIAAALVCALRQDEKVENPEYNGWAKFKPGSWTRFTIESESGGAKSIMEETATLKALDKDEATVEIKSSTTMEGKKVENPIQEQKHKARIDKSALSKTVKEAQEEVEVNGKKIKCKVVDSEGKLGGAKVTERIWLTEEIPGGIAKKETKGDYATMKIVVTQWEAK